MGRFARLAQAIYLLGQVFQHASDHTSSHSFHEERRKVKAENSNLQKDVQKGASLAERKEKLASIRRNMMGDGQEPSTIKVLNYVECILINFS
jgi:hypothetical protein